MPHRRVIGRSRNGRPTSVGKLSRNKGKTFERAIANDLREALGLDHATVKRGIQSRFGGGEVPDVMVEGLPIHWEVKHDNSVAPIAALRQAAADVATRRAAELPVAIVKRDRTSPVVWMYAGDLFVLLLAWRSKCGIGASSDPEAVAHRRETPPLLVSMAWSEFLVILAVVYRAGRDSVPTHV